MFIPEHNVHFSLFISDEANEQQDKEDQNVNVSRAGSSIHSKRLEEDGEGGEGGEEDANEEANEEEENSSNNYDTDVPITNLGVASNTQSIASSLQGIAT